MFVPTDTPEAVLTLAFLSSELLQVQNRTYNLSSINIAITIFY